MLSAERSLTRRTDQRDQIKNCEAQGAYGRQKRKDMSYHDRIMEVGNRIEQHEATLALNVMFERDRHPEQKKTAVLNFLKMKLGQGVED